jgi:uncharacterized protein (TIGR02246 family)
MLRAMTELSPSDERSIRAIIDHLADAWGRGDAGAFAAPFTEDSDYVAFDGSRLRGRAENEAVHRQLFATFLQDTRLVGEIESLRGVAPDVAVLHSSGAVVMPWQREVARERFSRQTYVFVKRAGQWQIAAFHNTRVRPVLPVREDSLGVRMFKLMARIRTALAGHSRVPS